MTDLLNAPPSPSSEVLRASTPRFKLFSARSIVLATFVGSPLAGGYLLWRNSSRLGNTSRAWNELAVTALGTLGMLLFAATTDDSNALAKAFGHVSALIGVFIVAFYTGKTQTPAITAHTQAGGELESGWKSFGVAVAGLIAMMFVVFLLVAATTPSYEL
ncbi:membrane hypothetical protein [Paraburkholderia tropica]|uniref:hypothetical protein n=1 Tax=Paraburkholderia TaxID=1822464 RepID=UPI001CAC9D78|nr:MULTISPECIES: hypothetical protein [Paraburkholderia]CAG9218152.1 membrane hypothetical protein [Paraburkholderia tropica]